MGFGLAVPPKFMDIVVKWATRDYPEVGNYVDDLRVPSSDTDAVSDVLLSYGLPTKEAENMESARVLDRLAAQDPTTGRCNVPTSPDSEWTLYCDASDVALGVVLESYQFSRYCSPPVSYQSADSTIAEAILCVADGQLMCTAAFKKIRSKLVVEDGVLKRSIKLPLGEIVNVPVIAKSLESSVLTHSHTLTGHGCRETMYRFLRERCFVADLASKCQKFVTSCRECCAANPRRGESVPPARASIAEGPWNIVQIDTLELGAATDYHCVLVSYDTFTKWVEGVPLRRHDAKSVASAFVNVCARWGPPSVVRCDNCTELFNQVTSALYDAFGVTVKRGAVRQPQSQGAAERFNRTLLNLIRKTLGDADDWHAELDILLYYYRVCPQAKVYFSL
ncbi:uncharacterized protein K02A2.6-like [Sycon ciliatum]|uniref:uncharacterized protein K02A2.6-like n=1 Tax=Sycon ciliatum TaxID=27933 RepID=UPI0031F625FF